MGATRQAAAARFERSFDAVVPLVSEEWPGLERSAVDATKGDLEALTALVAAHTERTKVGVRRHLLELLAVAESEKPAPGNGAANGAPRVPDVDEVIAAVRRFESFAAEEAKRVGGRVLPLAEAKVRQSPWVSLLVALVIGLVLGLWLNGGRRR
jgi:hypothetical protein